MPSCIVARSTNGGPGPPLAHGAKIMLMRALIGRMEAHRTTIAVAPGEALDARPRLFAALEAAFPVAFTPWQADTGVVEAVVAVAAAGAPLPTSDQLARYGVPVLAVAGDAVTSSSPQAVELLDVAPVDRRVRGIVVSERLTGASGGRAGEGEQVLAAAGTTAAWTRTCAPHAVHRVRSSLPELEADQVLYAQLSQRPLTIIALLQFLRELTAPNGWRSPPLRAAIVFDDPNLRWRSYGFIDYRELLAHAERHGYHAAMAMIPLDARRPHAATKSLFARRPDRLSLVFHGNDHVKGELMAPRDRGTALAMVAQALRRVERFERRSGLHVDRIMMPPHGLCSRHVTAALGALRFDGLCAIHPLPWTERPPSDPPLAGWQPAHFVAGCPVVPRIPLSSSAADIALTALLDHPLVLYGHHEDVAEGLEPLAEAAAMVNRLGDTRWMSVGEIAATNYALRVTGSDAVIRPFARRVRVELPRGITSLTVEAPCDATDAGALVGWASGSGAPRPFAERAVAGEGSMEVRLLGRHDVEVDDVPARAWRPWPQLRRAATEARDRVLPLRAARAR
jgi:hypothetical protein